jgi:hypothetical protein
MTSSPPSNVSASDKIKSQKLRNQDTSARSDQVESPGRKELAQVQWLEHDLFAKVVSTFADHALTNQPGPRWCPALSGLEGPDPGHMAKLVPLEAHVRQIGIGQGFGGGPQLTV